LIDLVVVMIEGFSSNDLFSFPVPNLNKNEKWTFEVPINFENHQKKKIIVYALYSLPSIKNTLILDDLISIKLSEEIFHFFDFMQISKKDISFVKQNLSFIDDYFSNFKEYFPLKDKTIQTFKIPFDEKMK
jgi:hypothetical protein